MSKYHIWGIILVALIVLTKFPVLTLSQETPTIRADPSEIDVLVLKGSNEQTTVTLKSTYSIDKTIHFQDDLSGTYPKVDLYSQFMTVPANFEQSRSVNVNPGACNIGSYVVPLTYYFEGDGNKTPVGTLTFHISIFDQRMDNWPLKAEPKSLNLSVPAGLSIVREVKLTNIAGTQIVGELREVNLMCVDTPYIEILGNHSIVLEKNESTKIKVRIDGAMTSSSTCYSMGITFRLSNFTMVEERGLVMFHVTTSLGPGLLTGITKTPCCAVPFTIMLILVVFVVVYLVRRRLKKKGLRPQANTIPTPRPSGAPRPGR
jgi:hypothetical protein